MSTQLTGSASPKLPTHVAFFPGTEFRVEFNGADGWDAVDALVSAHPGLGVPKIEVIPERVSAMLDAAEKLVEQDEKETGAPVIAVVPESETEVERAKRIGVSDWSDLKTDEAAKARIEGLHEKLTASGVAVDASRQLYATGTRMAEVGYENQANRAREHEQKLPLREAAEQLRERVRAENREDVVVTARELSTKVFVNGKLTIDGMTLQEQAIRGILGRCDSPALGFVFGMRDRMTVNKAALRAAEAAGDVIRAGQIRPLIDADRRRLGGTIQHELWMAGDTALKLRTRNVGGQRDIFAGVSPRYAPADAPEIVEQILHALPADAKGSWSYDPATTTWELRAEIWTPTPVAEQAVGEPFRGYVSFRSRDNGTGTLNGGGGIEIIACLNASTYVADGVDVSRRHIGAIVAEAEKMVAKARRSIDALCEAWGQARETVVEVPADLGAIPLAQALPGFWFGELMSKRSELAGVLRGSTKAHVAGLTDAYFAERRDPEKLVKADFAQAWTRYIQDQPAQARRDGEAAIASWMVSGKPVRFDAERVEA